MSLKGSKTTADFLLWNDMLILSQKLERDGKYQFALLIAVGSFTGLRISDLLSLQWKAILNQPYLIIKEKKTKKIRKIKINQQLDKILSRIANKYAKNMEDYLFSFSVQHINRQLKKFRFKYKLKINNFSTHSFRKTFGRHIWEQSEYSEKAITILSDIFNHSSYRITRRYLGINDDDIEQIYDLL